MQIKVRDLCLVMGTALVLQGIGQYNFISFMVGGLLAIFICYMDD